MVAIRNTKQELDLGALGVVEVTVKYTYVKQEVELLEVLLMDLDLINLLLESSYQDLLSEIIEMERDGEPNRGR